MFFFAVADVLLLAAVVRWHWKVRASIKAETLYCDPAEECSSTDGAEEMRAWRTDGSWLREKWRDIHYWFAGRLAPKAWRESLSRFALDDISVKTVKEGFSP